MFGMFKKKVKVAQREVKNFEKRDLMQACVGIGLLVGYASGEFGQAESDKLQKVLANQPALANFGSEVNETYARYNAMLKEAGLLMGKVQILREIGDVKGDQREAEDVLITGITVALSDGEMDDKERKMLEEIAAVLGLRLETYIEA